MSGWLDGVSERHLHCQRHTTIISLMTGIHVALDTLALAEKARSQRLDSGHSPTANALR